MNDASKSWRVIRPLGSGGMSTVWEIKTSDGERRALKRFAVDHGNAVFLRERFVAEGQVLERLSHPRLVHVYESGIDKENRPYFVMDLVLTAHGEARTLESLRTVGKVSEADAERFYEDLVDVLRYCHAHGVVHRDVKLNNILIDAEGHAVLSDFGVSRIVDTNLREELQLGTTFVTGETTGTRPVMGTYWYLAPELRKGGEAAPASDWYALGVTFFRLLTGLWYEPGTNAFDLLAPFAPHWRRRLGRLLADDPIRRTPGVGNAPARRFKVVGIGLVTSMLVLAACLGVWIACRSPVCEPVDEMRARFSLQAPCTVPFDAKTTFAFCPCPPGTNGCGDVSVTLTEPYLLGTTPVTRRQWFAVRGEPLVTWRGGEESPMTYVTRAEVDDFCARLNRRLADRLPDGYEIRLPTVAEWRLSYAQGNTMTNVFERSGDLRRAYDRIGWYGQGIDGTSRTASMRRYYEVSSLPVPLVKDIWPEFPPKVLSPGKNEWMRYSSQVAPVPVGLKPANDLGLHDLCGNCFERAYDTGPAEMHGWGYTEWGQTANGLYAGQGRAVTNPVVRSGASVLMLGACFAPDLPGDLVWKSPFDSMPLLGFRLCIGPKLTTP